MRTTKRTGMRIRMRTTTTTTMIVDGPTVE